MPTQLYRPTLAQLASGHNSPDYHALPAWARQLADAADAARDSYLALASACRQARAARGSASAVSEAVIEALDAAELAQWNGWQEVERRGAELLDGSPSSVRTPAQIGGTR